eukprot:9434197-Pyramimonas_sp.AAC.1
MGGSRTPLWSSCSGCALGSCEVSAGPQTKNLCRKFGDSPRDRDEERVAVTLLVTETWVKVRARLSRLIRGVVADD